MTYDVIFIAGLLSFFSPCIVPLLPVYFAHFSKGVAETVPLVTPGSTEGFTLNWRLILQTTVFVAGISTNFILLGFGAGMLGQILGSQQFLIGCGIVAVLLGLHQVGLLRWSFLERERRIHFKSPPGSGIIGSYLLGFTFSFGWIPCIGPVLGAVLGIASNQGQVLGGGMMMLVYSAGFAIPFIIISILGNIVLDRIKGINRHLEKLKIASGILIIVMGLLLITTS